MNNYQVTANRKVRFGIQILKKTRKIVIKFLELIGNFVRRVILLYFRELRIQSYYLDPNQDQETKRSTFPKLRCSSMS